MVLNLPADLYQPRAVASVSGLSGTGAGLGTLAATFATGVVSDHYSFAPILVVGQHGAAPRGRRGADPGAQHRRRSGDGVSCGGA